MSCCDCDLRNKQELTELINTRYGLEHQLKCYNQEIERLTASVGLCECCRERRTSELDHYMISKSEVEGNLSRVIVRIDQLMQMGVEV